MKYMKYLKSIILTVLLIIPSYAGAVVTSWDFSNSILQPLRSQWAVPIKVHGIVATSTTYENTFPRLNFTNATGTAATTTNFASGTICLTADTCRTTWPAGGTPGGSDTHVQFNDASSFGGDAGFIYNKTTDEATLVNLIITKATSTQATSTSLFAGQLTGNTLRIGQTGTSTINSSGDLLVVGSTTLQNATSTNFFSTTASSTNLFASIVNFGSSILSIISNTLTGLGIWDLGGATSFEIPNGASPTVDTTGEIAIDTTSGQFKFYDGKTTHILTGTSTPAFNIASTTLDAMGKSFNTATSSFLVKNDPEPITLIGFYCTASTTGTALVRFGDGTNFTETSTCTSGGLTLTPTNNTWTSFEPFVVQASSTAGVVNRITVTAIINKTAD